MRPSPENNRLREGRVVHIEHAKARAHMIKDPVTIVVHEGGGHAAEEWVEDEWSPFYEPDGPNSVV